MTNSTAMMSERVLPEYIPDDLGAPFKVVLRDSVRQVINAETGEIAKTIIPNPRGLLQTIAVSRLIFPKKLSGSDVKFIRKALKVKASELSDMIGVTAEHLSRCESGERVLSPGVERYLRMVLLLDHLKLPSEAEDNLENCEELRELYAKHKAVLDKLKIVMNGMKIPAVHDSTDELVLFFKVRSRHQARESIDDEDDDDWRGEEQSLAA